MRNFSLVVFIALLLGSAIGAPALYGRSIEIQLDAREPAGGAGQRFKSAINPAPIIQKMKQAIPRHLKTTLATSSAILKVKMFLHPKPGKAVFCTEEFGLQGAAHTQAEKYAAKIGHGSTLHNALLQHNIVPPVFPKGSAPRSPVYHAAAETWAQRASGDTHVFVDVATNPNDIYYTVERPILLKNKKVTTLTEHNIKTGQATVVKSVQATKHQHP